MPSPRKKHLASVKRVVVKIGSSLLTDPGKKGIRAPYLRKLALQIKKLAARKIEVVIVTSGAIAAGIFKLGLSKRPKEIARLQALAATGQSGLMHAYENAFNRSGLKVAQILLTREDLADRARYTNAHNTFNELFAYGIIPIVNENDSVAVEEIRFGDNDTLGVLVTYLCEADLLMILSDIDGFYTEDPRLNPKAQLVHEVERIDEAIERNARLSGSDVGTGGMQTKIRAAKSMMQSGVPMVIAHGRTPDVLNRVLAGEQVGTFFGPSAGRMNSRKRWLAWSVPTRGTIVIDAGAQKALLEKNTSLLATGIKGIRGTWGRGAVVEITNDQGLRIAKGIVNHSAQELESIKGLRNAQIAEKFGAEIAREVIHIDDMVKW